MTFSGKVIGLPKSSVFLLAASLSTAASSGLSCPAVAAENLSWSAHWQARLGAINAHLEHVGKGSAFLFGDSIVEGFYPHEIGNCYIVNGGLGGARASDAVEQIRNLSLSKNRPAIVILQFGTNDALDGVTEASVIVPFQRMVDYFKQLPTKVVILAPPPLEAKLAPHRSNAALASIYTWLQNLARSRGVEYVDAYSKIRGQNGATDGATTDGIHLTNSSYRQLEDKIVELVKGSGCNSKPN